MIAMKFTIELDVTGTGPMRRAAAQPAMVAIALTAARTIAMPSH
jgi:hypothetical protein